MKGRICHQTLTLSEYSACIYTTSGRCPRGPWIQRKRIIMDEPEKKSGDKSFIKEFIADAFDIDHGLFKTFVMLFKSPRRVIDAYIRDEKTNYYSPFKYVILTTTVLTFVFLLAIDLDTLVDNRVDSVQQSIQGETPQNEAAVKISNNAMFVFLYLTRRFSTLLMLFLMMPSFAIFSKILFKDVMPKFSNHFALSAYLVGQINCVQLLMCVPLFFLDPSATGVRGYLMTFDISAVAIMAYGYLRVFFVRKDGFVLRAVFTTILGSIMYLLLLTLVTISAAIVMYMYGN